MNQKRSGIILSYINLLMGMVVNVFLTPFLISSLGDVDYSLYKVMQSFAGPLTMFHLGVSTVVARCIVKSSVTDGNSDKEKRNTIALSLLVSAGMALFIVIAGFIMYRQLPTMYGDTYSSENIILGQKVFLLFVGSSTLHTLTDAFSGCLIGHERFTVSSAIPLAKTILKLLLFVICLKCGWGVLSIVWVDFSLAAGIFLFSAFYAIFVLHEYPQLTNFDLKQLFDIFSFGAAILLQAFVNQVNNNMDTMILGMYVIDKEIVTMYSSALAVYSIYNSLISVVTNFFLPKATKLVSSNASGKELTDYVIVPGRYQAIVAIACILGFALFGQDFIILWIGEQYLDAYWVVLMLIIPVTIPLVENAIIPILDVTMKRMFRSIVLVFMAVTNLIISVALVQHIGFWGAAIGTVLSLLLGHGLLMNIYYKRTYEIELGRMFFSIFKGILPAGLLATTICCWLNLLPNCSYIMFIVKCISFVIIYAVLLWLFGINETEKKMFTSIFAKWTRLFTKKKFH